jgi:hypothetical protein
MYVCTLFGLVYCQWTVCLPLSSILTSQSFAPYLFSLSPLHPLPPSTPYRNRDLPSGFQRLESVNGREDISRLAAICLFRTVCALPAMVSTRTCKYIHRYTYTHAKKIVIEMNTCCIQTYTNTSMINNLYGMTIAIHHITSYSTP